MSPALRKGPSASCSVPAMSNSPPLTCLVSISFHLLAVFSGVHLSGKSIYYIYFNWPHLARRPGISVQEENSFDFTALVYCTQPLLYVPCLRRRQMLFQEAKTQLYRVCEPLGSPGCMAALPGSSIGKPTSHLPFREVPRAGLPGWVCLRPRQSADWGQGMLPSQASWHLWHRLSL